MHFLSSSRKRGSSDFKHFWIPAFAGMTFFNSLRMGFLDSMTACGKKILVIDDEQDLVDMLEITLESEGYEVLKAYDGHEGLEKSRESKPDLILLDVMLPKMDGYQVCRLLKFDDSSKDIPIVMLTARNQKQDRLTGKRVGADEYLVKPFSNEDLLKKI